MGLHALRADVGGADSDTASWNDALASLARRGLAQADNFRTVFAGKDAFRESKHVTAHQSVATGTACADDEDCKLKEAAANRCNFGRVAMMQAYQAVNVGAHVMGVLVSSLCGCRHEQSQTVCALATIPPTCIFPY